MTDFDIKLLSCEDGSWAAFQADWRAQCDEVGEIFDEYAPDALSIIEGIATGTTPKLGGTNTTRVGALWDAETKRFYAACILNRAMLPNTPGYTLRVRQLIVSPLLDYGVGPVQMYPDVVIGVMMGIVHLSSNVLSANNIHFHLRSPEDMTFFRAFGVALGDSKVFASVQARGAWLYVEKVAAVGTAQLEETK
jgi:hypothetical protein